MELHFEKTSYRVKKRIFATNAVGSGLFCLKLTPTDQDVMGTFDPKAIYPVPNKWGWQGWTMVAVEQLPEEMGIELLRLAYENVSGGRKTKK